jgi:lipopolysaccharide-induced tumor necrosis factor-alpha factor
MNNQPGNNQYYNINQPYVGNQYPPPPRPQNPYNQIPPGNYHPIPNQYQPNQGFQPNPNPPFIPNNQGFVPNGVTGRYMCPFCRTETDSFSRKAPGGVTWIWCFALFLCTGICCCIPFCVESCKDTVMVCVVCQAVKGRIEANCC